MSTFTHQEVATDARQIARIKQRETAGAVPIRAALPIVALRTDGEQHLTATAFLDLRKRPDIADLIRIHGVEREDGDVRTEWRFLLDSRPTHYRQSVAILSATWSAPAVCRVRLVFNLWAHRPFLQLAIDIGHICITGARPIIPASSAYTTLGIPVSEDELRSVLNTAALIDVLRGVR